MYQRLVTKSISGFPEPRFEGPEKDSKREYEDLNVHPWIKTFNERMSKDVMVCSPEDMHDI